MTVRLSDVIVPEVFAPYLTNDTTKKADVFKSGLVRVDAGMSALLAGGGKTFKNPYWGDLSDVAPVIASDDPAKVITPQKIGTFKHDFTRQARNQAWTTANLVAELAGSDPMARISSRVTEYWARAFDRTTIATLTGIIADNVANDAGDMMYDATGIAGTWTIAGNTVNKSAMNAYSILEAKQTMGDRANLLKIIVMHSRVYTNLQAQNLITFVPNSQGIIEFPTYLGYRVVVTDNVPVVDMGGGNLHFVSYLAGEGILGWGESPPAKPVAVESEELQGNGSGVETLITRRQYALHMYGFHWKGDTVSADFPTDAELALAGNWDRAFPERKQIAFAAIKTLNG
jgi:hypothetical protein